MMRTFWQKHAECTFRMEIGINKTMFGGFLSVCESLVIYRKYAFFLQKYYLKSIETSHEYFVSNYKSLKHFLLVRLTKTQCECLKLKNWNIWKFSFKTLNVRFEFCKTMGNVALNSLMFV